jgi:hypothetical protein
MAAPAHIHSYLGLRGYGLEGIATSTGDDGFNIFGMDILLHQPIHLAICRFFIIKIIPNKRSISTPESGDRNIIY